MQDKIAGCLIGCALGDALGVPHEFRFHKNNIYTGILYIQPEFHFQFTSWKEVVGQYSDDTEMTLCNVRSIIESNGIYNQERTISKYQKWASGSKAIGHNTRALFKGATTIQGYQLRYDKLFKNTDPDTWTQSNGSLMRCSILSFFGDSAIIDCKLSNPHPVNIDSNKLYAFLIRSSANNLDPKLAVKQVQRMGLRDEVMDVFNSAMHDIIPSRNVTGPTKGWVLHGLYCAIWAYFHAGSFQDGIDTIIRMGGDTDTNGAIAGALLGAKFGFNIMCDEERTIDNIFTVLVANYDKGDNPRPEWLTLHDFFDIVNKLTELVDH